MLGYIGLLAGLGMLIAKAMRGVNILIATLVCSIIVAATNDLSISQAIFEFYPFGPLGAFTFAGKFLFLFVCGAIFGKIMAASHATKSIAHAIVKSFGVQWTLWVVMSVCALLTYGGVVVFIVIFTMYPLGISLMRVSNLPRRLLCGAICLGAGTFTMTAMPGSPNIPNVIAASALGTDLFAGAWIGLGASALMVILGMWYLEREWRLAKIQGEGYEVNEQDARMENLAVPSGQEPHWLKALTPLMVVLGVILLPSLFSMMNLASLNEGWIGKIVLFSNQQPILWPSLALIAASITAFLLFSGLRQNVMALLGQGADDAVMPLLNTAAVIGFGGVVSQTAAFGQFSHWILSLNMSPLLSIFTSVSVLSGIVGSATGGLQIFLTTLAPHYLKMGVEPEVLHRIANISAGGVDSLPHCGAVITMLMVMGLTHKQGYKDIFVLTVVIPVIAALCCIGVLTLV